MDTLNPRNVLWRNVCALMGEERPTVDGVARRTKCSRGTIQRMRDGSTSIGIDILADVAAAFGVQPWHLLVPNLDPRALPDLNRGAVRWPFHDVPLHVMTQLSAAQARHVEMGLKVALAAAGVAWGGLSNGTSG